MLPAIVTADFWATTRSPFPLDEMSLFTIAMGPNPTVPCDTENASSLLNPELTRIVFPEKTVLCFPEEYPTCTVAWRNVIPRIDTPLNPSETLKLRRASGRPVFPILGLKPFAASRFSAFMRLSESGIGMSALVRRRIVAPAGAAFMQSASVAPQPG